MRILAIGCGASGDIVALMQQYIVDAFVNGRFSGNPAAVVPLESWLEDTLMQSIAAENNLSETAFFVPVQDRFELRWFTPTAEIALCGHATLATSHVLFNETTDKFERLVFDTKSGPLTVENSGDGLVMDFPAIEIGEWADDRPVLDALGIDGEVLDAGGSPMVVVSDRESVANCVPDLGKISALPGDMVIVTAPADTAADGEDVVARVFAPSVGIDEDPATGAAHCAIAPFWCSKLSVDRIRSLQISARTGSFECEWLPDSGRVKLKGTCHTFSRGELAVFDD